MQQNPIDDDVDFLSALQADIREGRASGPTSEFYRSASPSELRTWARAERICRELDVYPTGANPCRGLGKAITLLRKAKTRNISPNMLYWAVDAHGREDLRYRRGRGR
jgi:hypothetical protein